jgi:hypothetical protein
VETAYPLARLSISGIVLRFNSDKVSCRHVCEFRSETGRSHRSPVQSEQTKPRRQQNSSVLHSHAHVLWTPVCCKLSRAVPGLTRRRERITECQSQPSRALGEVKHNIYLQEIRSLSIGGYCVTECQGVAEVSHAGGICAHVGFRRNMTASFRRLFQVM